MVDPMAFGSYREFGEAQFEEMKLTHWHEYKSGLFECGRCGLFEETPLNKCPRCGEPMLKPDTWRGS